MAENHVLLETIELSQSAASVTFDNIPQTGYTDLKIVASMRSAGSPGSGYSVMGYRFNNSTSSYTARTLDGTGAAAYSDTMTTATISGNTYGRFTSYGINTNATTANTFTSMEWLISNYTSSNNKSSSVDYVTENNGTTAYQGMVGLLWSNSASITQIELIADTSFAANSTFSLYGLAATGTTPTIAPKASGGNIVANDGTYWYHAFLTSGTFTPVQTLSCDYLVVAGGGGGGFGHGGGGGGGGLRSTVTQTGGNALGVNLETALSVTAQAYPITVGAGGAAGATSSLRASNGSNSIFSTITSTGGGGGGSRLTETTGAVGGSGGGGSLGSTGGAGTSNQGFAGGGSASTNPGSGGGGAGAVGSTAITIAGVGANGGAGVTISAFATPTTTGVSSAYAGGGGGGSNGGGGTSTNGSATAGGGGGGTTVGVAATTNTGGGGGGGAFANNAQQAGAAGGSGIVIIRYAMA
jgi:hypothetical protein